jgi:hypothetical protein
MENNKDNSPEKGGGIGPVVIITAVLVTILIALKFIIS